MKFSTKIKVLYVTTHPDIGGGETILLDLINNLDHQIFAPIVVTPQKGQLSQKLKKMKVRTYFLKLDSYAIRTFFVPGFSPADIYKIIRLVRKIKPDLIHLNHLNLVIYAGICAKILKIPLVATAHGPWDSYYFYQDIANQFFVDKILANTQKTAKLLTRRQIVRHQKVATIPFGIDIKTHKPSSINDKIKARKLLGLSQNDLIITIVGRLDPIKNHLTFLKTAKLLNNRIPNATFFIVGSEEGNFSKAQLSTILEINRFLKLNSDLQKKVVFGGFIDPTSQVYAASDILVSTSISESFGLSLAEAAASGLPVVATNNGNQNFIVKDGKSGFLVESKKHKLIANKILILAKNPPLRKKFGQNARKHILINFPLARYVSSVQDCYLKLLKRRN